LNSKIVQRKLIQNSPSSSSGSVSTFSENYLLGMATSRGGGGSGWTSLTVRALTALDLLLLLATWSHHRWDGRYWVSLEASLEDARLVRGEWEQHLETVRHASAQAVSRSAQLQARPDDFRP
jgi:hypothetical protein